MATPIPANECSFTELEISQATGAVPPRRELRTSSVSIDSRSAAPGSLFMALRGRRDGHEYLDAAARAGAAAAIVERGRASHLLPCFEVEDTLRALGQLARIHLERIRRQSRLPVIAIGGAAGKTTTKELTAAVTRAIYGKVLATPGNLNNLIGVPMTIFTLNQSHRAAVLECGTNRPGEIAQLSRMIRPEVSLVLNVDLEHTEGLGSLAGVADEEAALFADSSAAVVGTAEPLLLARIPAGLRTITFGEDRGADVRLEHREPAADGQRLRIGVRQDAIVHRFEVELKLLGATSALNAAAAVAAGLATVGRALSRMELTAIAVALGQVTPVEGRMRPLERGGVVVIDDSYNSNPRSLRAALATAREVADSLRARLVVAIGDMLELGEFSASAHDDAIQAIIAVRPAVGLLTGPEISAALARTLDPGSGSELLCAPDSVAAGRLIPDLVQRGDVLLVKGSRGVAMERIIEAHFK